MATAPATRQHGAPLERTSHPGVYRRGRRWVVVYRIGGRQSKRAAGTFAEARELKCAADARAAEQRLGPPLHAWALAEIPAEWRPLFDLLASTGARISEALALRWSDVDLGEPKPCVRIRRAVVRGVIGPPKSRHGIRTLPISPDLAAQLRAARPQEARPDELVFARPDGNWVRIDHLRRGVLAPAAQRAGIAPLALHAFRHTCAAMLIANGTSPLQLQRWMGHHSAAYTLETYGHLLDGGVGPPLDLDVELA